AILSNLLTIKLRYKMALGLKQIEQIEQGQNEFDINHKHHRVYSSLTKLMSPLRHFLKYENKHLVEVDIRNSVPYHLSLLFKEKFWTTQEAKMSFISIFPELFKIIK